MLPEQPGRAVWSRRFRGGLLAVLLGLGGCFNHWEIKPGSYRPLPDGVEVTPLGTLLASGEVVRVSDADTLTVLGPDGNRYKIRLQGIDAPENKQNYGHYCTAKLKRMVSAKTVAIEAYKLDRYQRIVAKVSLQDQDLALLLIRQGCGWHYTAYAAEQNTTDREAYARAESEARRHRLGLWQAARPQAPWDYRRQHQ